MLYRNEVPERDALLSAEEFALDPERGQAGLTYDRLGYLFESQTWWVHSTEAIQARGVIVLRTETLDEDVRFLGLGELPKTGPSPHPALSADALASLTEFYHDDYVMLAGLD
jgi:hypothetical protein